MWKFKTDKLAFYSLCLLSCFPLLNMRLTVIAIILFVIASVINGFVTYKYYDNSFRLREFGILFAPFVLIFIRTALFDRSESALSYLEVSLSWLVFPLAFYLSPPPNDGRMRMIPGYLFTGSVFITVLAGILSALSKILIHLGPGKYYPTFDAMINDESLPYYVRTLFEDSVGIHPTHASFFLGIAILIVFYMLISNFSLYRTRRKVLLVFVILALTGFQLILASRTPFAATVAAIPVLLFLNLKNKLVALYTAVGMVALFVILMLFVPTIYSRFSEVTLSNAQMPTVETEDSFNLRAGIYKCGISIVKENWLTGVGPGNIQKHMNECYDQVAKEVYEGKNYNTHNQFLDYWAGLGIAGPVALLFVLLYLGIGNLRRKNYLPVALSVLFFISFLTENMLTRQNGIVPFVFFTAYFFYSDSRRKPGFEQ